MKPPESHKDHDEVRPTEPEERKPKRAFIGGFDHAWSGIRLVVSSQRNMRFHVLAAFAVVVLGLLLGLPALELALLALTISAVFAAEMVNTAVEAVVDLASPERHPLAKTAKDCAAGAVLVLSVGAVVVGVLVFHDEISRLLDRLFDS
ncbi:diacylglycerol kinase family protein [Rubrobacter indicoceani]|uniref:diacylglycerol kinase family protein n=1 Tax=Rubrobacter indicoceani TaxID=2051957 RepID=UPI00196915CB|nr:diacylglycerol kinase family protein [Rubrobacter indicoceani]